MISSQSPRFVDVTRQLEQTALEHASRIAFEFLDDGRLDGQRSRRTYGQLDRRARTIAARLLQKVSPGERALLLFPPGLEFIDAFFGCLYAGVIAVPAYPPDPARLDRTLPRLERMANQADVSLVLTNSLLAAMKTALPSLPESLARCPWLSMDDIEDKPETGPLPRSPDDIAFIQYTSGSTEHPRGVIVTHGNLVANGDMIASAMALESELVVGVSWLPLYHDMGLIGTVIEATRLAAHIVLISPLDFLKRPLLWLETISAVRATGSGGPNFAYGLCARKATPEDVRRLDLSNWRVAFSGAEQVDCATMRRFAEVFEPAGFDPRSLFPTYGLAESTLLVSGGPAKGGLVSERVSRSSLEKRVIAPHKDGIEIAACGHVTSGELRIVDPERLVVLDNGHVGEIWVQGAHVAAGYWRNPEATKSVFGATLEGANGTWLRTGDLGYLRDGQLWVTGRIKELMIVHGRNISPHDVEDIATRAHASVRAGCVAAFSVPTDTGEGIGLVVEAPTSELTDAVSAIEAAVRRTVADELGVSVEGVLVVAKRQLPKTSSGKLQRHACRELFLERRTRHEAPEVAPFVEANARDLERVLLALERQTGLSASHHSPNVPLVELGLDSIVIAGLSAELETMLGQPVPVEHLARQTLTQIASLISSGKPAVAAPDASSASAWKRKDLSNFARTTGEDLFEIHEHFETWLNGARPGGYELYEMPLTSAPSANVDVRSHSTLTNLASYNYLGLSTRPEVQEAAIRALQRFGLSASGSPMLSGFLEVHEQLEHALASCKNVESVLVFPTGYATNLGVLSALVGPGDVVIADALAHASIVDGVMLARARIAYFRHNDMNDLERMLRRHEGRKLVAVEGVYSMDGDLAPLPEVAALCRRYGARLLVDEAHSAFVFGTNGRGAVEHFGVDDHVDIHIGTLSKTLGGMGGYVGGSRRLVDYVRSYARSRTFSCALSPVVVGGLLASLEIWKREPELRARLWSNVEIMKRALTERRVDIGHSASQILPVLVHDDEKIFDITRDLLARGVYLNPVRYPAVKQHHSRFRISVSAAHEANQLQQSAGHIADVLTHHGVIA